MICSSPTSCGIKIRWVRVWMHAPAIMLAAAAPAPPGGAVDFVKEVKPLLEASCVKCHGPDKSSSGYRLHTKELAFKRGEKAEEAGVDPISAGDSQGSLMIQFITAKEDERMPPKGKAPALTAAQVELLKRWIDSGAKWPDSVQLTPPPGAKK